MQSITFVQVNIYKGKYLSNLLIFLKKINADFITMQEVSGGDLSLESGDYKNTFVSIKRALNVEGVLFKDAWLKNNEGSIGSAVLSKFPINNSYAIKLQEPREVTLKDVNDISKFPHFPRSLIQADITINERAISVFSWHGAWTAPPTDTFETLRQAQIVAEHLKQLKNPFILGGDLNNIIESNIIKTIEKVATNWMRKSNAKQTTHPKVHKIVPRGYLVDYIFTSRDFKLKRIDVPEVLVSDHLPVVAQLEL